jgi:GrpB-like predicted nucleotidyltransferase (UPF0157 family)
MNAPDPDWPSWATEAVELAAPEADWPERGRLAARSLGTVLAPWLVQPVEHVGSTAIPGLVAKPILDLLAIVADLGIAEEVAELLAPGGWHYVPPELDGRADERFFVQVIGGSRAAHLHLMPADAQRWQDIVRFRDALRGDRQLAAAYGQLKSRLAEQHRDDREGYTAAKRDFVDGVLRTERPSG